MGKLYTAISSLCNEEDGFIVGAALSAAYIRGCITGGMTKDVILDQVSRGWDFYNNKTDTIGGENE